MPSSNQSPRTLAALQAVRTGGVAVDQVVAESRECERQDLDIDSDLRRGVPYIVVLKMMDMCLSQLPLSVGK